MLYRRFTGWFIYYYTYQLSLFEKAKEGNAEFL